MNICMLFSLFGKNVKRKIRQNAEKNDHKKGQKDKKEKEGKEIPLNHGVSGRTKK